MCGIGAGDALRTQRCAPASGRRAGTQAHRWGQPQACKGLRSSDMKGCRQARAPTRKAFRKSEDSSGRARNRATDFLHVTTKARAACEQLPHAAAPGQSASAYTARLLNAARVTCSQRHPACLSAGRVHSSLESSSSAARSAPHPVRWLHLRSGQRRQPVQEAHGVLGSAQLQVQAAPRQIWRRRGMHLGCSTQRVKRKKKILTSMAGAARALYRRWTVETQHGINTYLTNGAAGCVSA